MLDHVDLEVGDGERILLAGASGAGKSTLLRALAGLLAEVDGELSGTVTVDLDRQPGRPPQDLPGAVGLMTQDPTASTVSVSVGRDIAFGPENLGLPTREVLDRVRWATTAAGFPYGPDRRTAALSGGERQRLALAGLLALAPRLLLLDEPLAMLDPRAADAVRTAVLSAVSDRRTGLVVVDHHLDRWWDSVDRLVVLAEGGVVIADGLPDTVLADSRDVLTAAGSWLPARAPAGAPIRPGEPGRAAVAPGAALLRADGVGVLAPDPLLRGSGGDRGRRDRVWGVRDASTALHPGSVTALTGPSGAGKSTLLAALAGLTAPAAGLVAAAPALAHGLGPAPHRWRSAKLAARISWTSQTPTDGFVQPTVAGEVGLTPRALGRPLSAGHLAALVGAAGLGGREHDDPRRLSGGEQRRLAVVAALAAQAPVLLLDEPTVGQDRGTWSALVDLLRAAIATGTAVGIATHDQLLIDTLADTVTVLGGT